MAKGGFLLRQSVRETNSIECTIADWDIRNHRFFFTIGSEMERVVYITDWAAYFVHPPI